VFDWQFGTQAFAYGIAASAGVHFRYFDRQARVGCWPILLQKEFSHPDTQD
jgi:hypothetical protein